MLSESSIDHVPVWALYICIVLWLLLGAELGFRLGGLRANRWPDSSKTSSSTVVGATLGLLAFMLAFTFGMSSTRFEARKQLVLEEASDLLVSYQRAQSLPMPERKECTELLREYVDLRLAIVNLKTIEEMETYVKRSEAIQDALWAQAAILSEKPNSVVSGFMASLADLSDLQIKRVRAAVWNRIPLAIEAVLLGIAFLALAAVGFNAGLHVHRTIIPSVVLALIFSSVIVIIIDLERPRQELFHISQEPMADVARRINSAGL